MGFTTSLGLHSQTTRLEESVSWSVHAEAPRGSHPLGRPVPGNLGKGTRRERLERLQFASRKLEIFTLGYSRFARRY